jgi:hypothetical protein
METVTRPVVPTRLSAAPPLAFTAVITGFRFMRL